MILSMTGFGEAQLEEDGHVYHLEIRTVNNRYLKLSIRLPEQLAFMEAPLEQRLRQRLTRGSVTLRLHIRDLSAGAAPDLNMAALEQYVQQLRTLQEAHPAVSIDLAALAAMPGVCQPREMSESQRQQAESIVQRLLEQALDGLVEMRTVEGKSLAEDLGKHCEKTREHVAAIAAHAPDMVESYRDRLRVRIEQLIAGSNVELAQDDLLREVSIYAERSDVSEELNRLGSHLEQFAAAVASREPAGRKLEFISQEMLREANTIGAKAGDADIARHVIEIKGAIDRIKEQVQNVE